MAIRKLEARDAAPMLAWMRDADVTRHLRADFSSMAEADAAAFVEAAAAQDASSASWHFAIEDEVGGYVGTISLKGIDRDAGTAEYAIVTARQAHGKGLARKASEELLEVAFGELGLNRVYLCVTTDNEPANRLYRRLGFSEEGTWRQHLLIDGRLRDLRWYGLLKDEWESRKKQQAAD